MKCVQYTSQPAQPLQGEVTMPGDKSISHRAVMLGSIAEGETTVHGFLNGEDCQATLGICRQMGVAIDYVADQPLVIQGVGKYGLTASESAFDCGNSGTSMRLLAGLLAGQSFDSILTGDASLQRRPMERISDPLTRMGASIQTQAGKPPLYITGNKTLTGIHYSMPHASAQVKSCLLLAGLYAQGETVIIEPIPTRDHTERLLQAFSCPIKQEQNNLIISGDAVCKATEIWIPGDISSAAFFLVAASIIPGSVLLIRKTGINPGRTGIVHILKKMGADITLINEHHAGAEPVADILVKYAPLTGIDITKDLVPLAIDEFPAICIAAAAASGTTTLHGAAELRVKESDRIAAMVNGLQTMGIKAEAFADGFAIEGGVIQGGTVDSLGDHRIAMAFAIAGQIAQHPVYIQDCANVRTSFPNFIALTNQSGMDIRETLYEK